jgi:hypothetical protein
MNKDEAGALIDLEFEGWKRELESMHAMASAAAPAGTMGSADEVEHLHRELQGLRIKKVATWHAPEERWEDGYALFHGMWSDWVDRAEALKASLSR